MYERKFSCPAVVNNGSKCDNDDINTSNNFVKERSVDSDDGITTAESVVDTLDKLNGLNTTIKKRKNKARINKESYGGPSNLLVGSSSRYFKDFRRDDAYRKKIMNLIEKKVMTETKYAIFRKEDIYLNFLYVY